MAKNGFSFAKLPIISWFIELMKRVSIPGFDGVPIYDVFVFFFREIQNDDITIRAAAVAFNFFLALFPTIIFFFTLIPYVFAFVPDISADEMTTTLITSMSQILPGPALKWVNDTISDLLKIERGGLLSFGFVMALFFSTNGMYSMMVSFDKRYAAFRKRGFLKSRLVAIKLTMLLLLLVVVSVVLIIAGEPILDAILEAFNLHGGIWAYAVAILRWFVIIFMFFMAISLIYYYGPAVKKKFRFISAGSTLATILSIAASLGFSFYVDNFNTYNVVYGAFGALIVILLWFYFNALILLVGFELNAAIAVNKYKILEEQERDNAKKTAVERGEEDTPEKK